MPPKQRSSSKAQSSKTKSKSGRSGSSDETATPTTEQVQEQEERAGRGRRESKVKWLPVFKRIGYISLIFFVPALLNYAALNQEARMLVPKGSTLYDIGWGQRMMLHCSGEGLPTVILDAPIGQSSDAWMLVWSAIAKRTKVCVYDRAGLGFSDRAYANTSEYANDTSKAAKDRDRTQPSTVERMVDDLHRLVNYASNQPKPLLLVGVDYSTFIARFYTQLFEHDVAGLLLIDPLFEGLFLDKKGKESADSASQSDANNGNGSSSNQPVMTWSEFWTKHLTSRWSGVWISAAVGFNRLSLMLGLMSPVEDPKLNDLLPNDVILRKKYLMCQPKHLSAAFYEFFFTNDSMSQMRSVYRIKPFPSFIPITIATYRDKEKHLLPELSKAWKEGENKLIHIVHPDSKHIILPGSDYLTLYHHSQAVTSAVLTMVENWRRESKLAA